MNKLLTLLYVASFIFSSSLASAKTRIGFQDCDKITQVSLEKLITVLEENDFLSLEPVLGTIQSSCGESEFTQRLRILRALIEKNSTEALITDYLSKDYQEILIMRWDYSVEPAYQSIYKKNKSAFNYVPLNHPVDSLIKLKSAALLNSASYALTDQERKIAFLFSDNIDAFYQTYQDNQPTVAPAKETKFVKVAKDDKYRAGILISAGVEFPISGNDPVFKASPAFGLMYSSKLSVPFIYELGAKIRVNTNDRAFDFLLYDEIETVNSAVSFSLGGNIGYKIFDNDKFIISPKIGLYYEATSTGLSEVTDSYYYDDYYYDDYEQGSSSVRYHNVNAMRTTVALSLMRHLYKKQYIGLEGAYHYISYEWEKNLLTEIQPNYASLQVFFRF